MKNLLKLFKTKTVWVNLLGGAAQIINLANGQFIPAEYAVVAQGLINIIVRAITKKSISEK
jgi:hypothetical protein